VPHKLSFICPDPLAQMNLIACGKDKEGDNGLESVEETYKPKGGKLPGRNSMIFQREANGHHEEGKTGKEDQGALHVSNITTFSSVHDLRIPSPPSQDSYSLDMGRGDSTKSLLDLEDVFRSASSETMIDSEAIILKRLSNRLRAYAQEILSGSQRPFTPLDREIEEAIRDSALTEEIDLIFSAIATKVVKKESQRAESYFRYCGLDLAESPFILDIESVLHLREKEKAVSFLCGLSVPEGDEYQESVAHRPRGSFENPSSVNARQCFKCKKASDALPVTHHLFQAAKAEWNEGLILPEETKQMREKVAQIVRERILSVEVGQVSWRQMKEDVEDLLLEDMSLAAARDLLSLGRRQRGRATFNWESATPRASLALQMGLAVKNAYGDKHSWPSRKRLAAIYCDAFKVGNTNDQAIRLYILTRLLSDQWPKAIPLILEKQRHHQNIGYSIGIWTKQAKTLKIVADVLNRKS
jgi:hypothetical protein